MLTDAFGQWSHRLKVETAPELSLHFQTGFPKVEFRHLVPLLCFLSRADAKPQPAGLLQNSNNFFFFKVVSRQIIEYSNVLKRHHFFSIDLDVRFPPATAAFWEGSQQNWLQVLFSSSTTHAGGFQLCTPPVNSMCWFHLTLRKTIFHLPLSLWKEEKDKRAGTKEKEKIHQRHQFRARSLTPEQEPCLQVWYYKAWLLPGCAKSSFWKAVRYLKASIWTVGAEGTRNVWILTCSNLKTRLSPFCARGRDDDREEVSDTSHLVWHHTRTFLTLGCCCKD